jgi:hypothetical protein
MIEGMNFLCFVAFYLVKFCKYCTYTSLPWQQDKMLQMIVSIFVAACIMLCHANFSPGLKQMLVKVTIRPGSKVHALYDFIKSLPCIAEALFGSGFCSDNTLWSMCTSVLTKRNYLC